MVKISEKLQLNVSQLQLDFYDYNFDVDNDMYFDPYYIKNSTDPFISNCSDCIISFFNRFIYLKNNGYENEARDLFLHLNESNDVSMGMSKGSPKGKGVGSLDSQKIFDAISESVAFKSGVATGIEDVKLFIDGIGKDKASDMITNLIRLPLLEYTIEQCELLGIDMFDGDSSFYWDLHTGSWERKRIKRLVIDGKNQLLYPRNMVSQQDHYVATRFFRMYILESLKNVYIENDSSLVKKKYDKNGVLVSVSITKKAIEEDLKRRGEYITKDWVANFAKNNPEVFNNFKKDTINHMSNVGQGSITDDDIEDLIETIKKNLQATKLGADDATKYHRLMSGILELLFYPYLAHPKLEEEIHSGRKRIDIRFTNIAQKGFFFLLGNKYDIPCSFIIVECKNYSHDIANPELDQIAGRFSANRGKFGIICCRDIKNEELFLKRENDTYKDKRGLIIHFTDKEILQLLDERKVELDINNFLIRKYNQVILK